MTAPEEARYVQAWHVFTGPDGALSAGRDALRITIGVTHAGRVRVTIPEGLALAPEAAETVSARIADAAQIARDPAARFTPADDQATDDQRGAAHHRQAIRRPADAPSRRHLP